MGRIELQLPPRLEYVGLARQLAAAAARQAALRVERIEDLELAVGEAVTNAMLAHRRPTSGPDIVVVCEHRDDMFLVEVRDRTAGQEPDSLGRGGDLTTDGDLAVVLIRGLADEVDFLPGDSPGGNTAVRMRFELDGLPETAGA